MIGVLRALVLASVLFLISGCGKKAPDSQGKTLTRQQRDSVLSETNLPGAGTVKKAIAAADSAEARSERLAEETE